ncbi:MAG: cell division protein FtsA [Chitinophagales bacterium]
MVDNEPMIKDPVGMCGIRLEANFHIITGQISAAQNIKKCVEKAGLQMVDMILEPLASAAAVLSDEEKEAGVALVDIGGGTTDIAIFQDGIIRHTYVIPFGGNVVTEDIKEGCMVMRSQAEVLKCRFGSAISDPSMDNQIVSIPGMRGKEPKEISVRNLANIINARMEEILEHVDAEISMSGFKNKLIAGVVVTGGGAQLKNLVQLVEYVTGHDARIGLPIEHLASSKTDVKHPMYSTGVGLVLNGFEDHEMKLERIAAENAGRKIEPEEAEIRRDRRGLIGRLILGAKEMLTPDVDAELK